jgi:hypothetical protein
MSVLLPNEVDISKLNFDKKKQLKGGPENCKLFYDNRDLNIQVPRIKVPFGVSSPPEEYNKTGKDKFTFELSLDTRDEKIAEFKKLLENLDEYNLKYVAANSKELFGTESSVDEVKKFKLYTSMIKQNLDKTTKQKVGDYPDRMRVKLPVFVDGPRFKVYSSKKQEVSFYSPDTKEIDWSWAQKGMDVVPIIQCEGLWVINGKAYCGWRMACVRLCEGSSRQIGLNSFRDNDEEFPVAEVVVEEEEDEKVDETVVEEEE